MEASHTSGVRVGNPTENPTDSRGVPGKDAARASDESRLSTTPLLPASASGLPNPGRYRFEASRTGSLVLFGEQQPSSEESTFFLDVSATGSTSRRLEWNLSSTAEPGTGQPSDPDFRSMVAGDMGLFGSFLSGDLGGIPKAEWQVQPLMVATAKGDGDSWETSGLGRTNSSSGRPARAEIQVSSVVAGTDTWESDENPISVIVIDRDWEWRSTDDGTGEVEVLIAHQQERFAPALGLILQSKTTAKVSGGRFSETQFDYEASLVERPS